MHCPQCRVSTVLPWVIDTGMFRGFYTPVMLLLPELKPDQVAARIVEALLYGDEEVFIPGVLRLLTNLARFLPRWAQD
jgi:hypothetical protein